jgi:hypothetical protein
MALVILFRVTTGGSDSSACEVQPVEEREVVDRAKAMVGIVKQQRVQMSVFVGISGSDKALDTHSSVG